MAGEGVQAWSVFGEVGLEGLGASLEQLNLFGSAAEASGDTIGQLKNVAAAAASGIARALGGVGASAQEEAETTQGATKNMARSWKEFVTQRLAAYRQEEGGHAAAMKRLSEEWKAHKETTTAAKDAAGALAGAGNAAAGAAPKLKENADAAGAAGDAFEGVGVNAARGRKGLADLDKQTMAAQGRLDLISNVANKASQALFMMGGVGGRLGGVLQSLTSITGGAAGILGDLHEAASATPGQTGPAASALTSLTAIIGGMTTKTLALTAATVALGLTLGVGLVGWTNKAIQSYMKFDDALNESMAIMGRLNAEMRDDLQRTARDVATSTRFGAEEAAKGYYYLASAGYDVQSSLKALPVVANFAQAGAFGLERATTMLADSQSALGMKTAVAEQNLINLTRIADVLTVGNIKANASVEQLAESLTTKAGARMRTLGMEVEAGVAVLAAFADQGVKGALAGERLNIILRDLPKVAVANAAAFKQYNIEIFDGAGNLRNMADVIEDFENALGPVSDSVRANRVEQLGLNDELADSISTLLGVSEKLRDYETALNDVAGATAGLANNQLQSLAARWDLVKNKVKDNEYAFGRLVHGVIATTIDFLDDLADLTNLVARGIESMGGEGENAASKISLTTASTRELKEEIERLNDEIDKGTAKSRTWLDSLKGAWNFMTGMGPSPLGEAISTEYQRLQRGTAEGALADRERAAQAEYYSSEYWTRQYGNRVNAQRQAEEELAANERSWGEEQLRIRSQYDERARAQYLALLRERLAGLAQYSEEWRATNAEIMQMEGQTAQQQRAEAERRADEEKRAGERAARERESLDRSWLQYRIQVGEIATAARLDQIAAELRAAQEGTQKQLDLLREQFTLQQQVQRQEMEWLQYRIEVGEIAKDERIRQINQQLAALRAANQAESTEALRLLRERNSLASDLTQEQIRLAQELAKKNRDGAIVALNAWKTSLSTMGATAPALIAEVDAAIAEISGNVVKKAKGTRGEIIDTGKQLGEDLLRGFITGSQSMEDLVKQAIANLLINIALKAAYAALGIASPSREMAWVGRMTMLGFVEGVKGAHAQVGDVISRETESIADVIAGSFLGAAGRGSAFGFVDSLGEQMRAAFHASPALTGAEAFGYAMAQSAAAGITDGAAALATAWTGAVPEGMMRMGPAGMPPGLEGGIGLNVPIDRLPPALTPFETARDNQWITLLSESLVTYKQRGGRFDD